MLPGIIVPRSFGVAARAKGSALSGGTNIGNATGSGGLAAAFDGTTNSANTACATRPGANAYVGKTLTKRVWSVDMHGSNNQGYWAATGSSTHTLYGKTGSAPASGTDGTSLGSLTFTPGSNESAAREIVSSDNETLWDHIWVYFARTGSENFRCAELVFYEST